MIEDNSAEEVSDDERAAIHVGLDSLEKHPVVPMEVILADLGFTVAEFEAFPESLPHG